MHEQRRIHEAGREPCDDVDGVVRRADLDIPRVRTAWTGELDGCFSAAEDEDLGLDRPLDVEPLHEPASPGQAGFAFAATPARVTRML